MNLTIRSCLQRCARCHRNQRQLLGSAAGSESSRTKLWSGFFLLFWTLCQGVLSVRQYLDILYPSSGHWSRIGPPWQVPQCHVWSLSHSIPCYGFYRWIWDTMVSNSFPLIQTSSSYKNCTWGPVCLADHPSCSSGSMKSIQGVQFHPIVKVD